jgi:hypothetical protein
MTEQFTFFWGGPFSQWHKSNFTVCGIKYNCAEQFMMAEKARLFKDKISELAILAERNPREQKALGRKVTNFDLDIWQKNAKLIVYRGSLAKYSQDKELLATLMATKGTTLVEASPYDKIWGIGLLEGDPNTLSRDTWQGLNWLGEILTQVREDLS